MICAGLINLTLLFEGITVENLSCLLDSESSLSILFNVLVTANVENKYICYQFPLLLMFLAELFTPLKSCFILSLLNLSSINAWSGVNSLFLNNHN